MAVLPGYQDTDVEARVTGFLAANGRPPGWHGAARVTVGINREDLGLTAKAVNVELDYTFVFLGPIMRIIGGTLGNVTLHANSEMRTETAVY